jgi:hypothetical protein
MLQPHRPCPRRRPGACRRAEAREAFDTFNIDLMYALPGQTLAQLEADLDTALAFAPPHLSIYHLTVEPNTAFAVAPPVLPDDDLASDMLDLITERTGASGLQRYEVSAFAQPGHRCRHNLNYWQFGDYLGIGAGAHGKLSFPHRVLRQVRWREPAAYMEHALAGNAVSNEHEVARARAALRVHAERAAPAEGFDWPTFSARTGLPPSAVQQPCRRRRPRGCCIEARARCGPRRAASTFCRTCRRCSCRPESALHARSRLAPGVGAQPLDQARRNLGQRQHLVGGTVRQWLRAACRTPRSSPRPAPGCSCRRRAWCAWRGRRRHPCR